VNTHSLGKAELLDRGALRRALEADPRRLAHPIPHEPLFALAERRGFDWRACNALGALTHRPGRGTDATLALDWFFARGLETDDPRVLPAAALSDHDAVAITIRPA
jgi:hypothetical protein